MATADKPRNRLFTTRGTYDYFDHFFKDAGAVSKLVVFAFFLIFLIVPILGGPSNDSEVRLESGAVFFSLNIVFFLTAFVVHRHNRDLEDGRLRRAGRTILLMVFGSILAYSLVAMFPFLLGSQVASVLRVTSSIVIIVPLVLMISVLVESVIRHGIVEVNSRVPIGLVFLTIFLIIYTFATVYFVNGLLVKTDVVTTASPGTFLQVNFDDAFYFSGLIFTTLGSSNIFPVGDGKWVMLFESVSGYLVLGFLTAIFIQAIISGREGGRS
jgi:hypothetical protein